MASEFALFSFFMFLVNICVPRFVLINKNL
jgi:hypothetical protein